MSKVVLAIGPGLPLREAARLMSERNIGAAIVVDDELPAPRILSERDVLRAVGNGNDPDSDVVGDHARNDFITASPDWSMERAAMEMSNRRIRHLLVIDQGEIVGVLSIRDIVRCWMLDGATANIISPEVEAGTAS